VLWRESRKCTKERICSSSASTKERQG
jgi:hypothetical protein